MGMKTLKEAKTTEVVSEYYNEDFWEARGQKKKKHILKNQIKQC